MICSYFVRSLHRETKRIIQQIHELFRRERLLEGLQANHIFHVSALK